MLLGASVSITMIAALGSLVILGIACIVALAIGTSYFISHFLGLPQRMSILIACGNSICGNSAIAAVAPVIGADSDDIASSISFTAVPGRARTRKTCAKPAHRYSPDLLPETTGRMSCVGRQAIGVRVASRSVAASTIWRRVAFESRFRARPGSAPFGHPSPSPRQSRHSDRGGRGSYL